MGRDATVIGVLDEAEATVGAVAVPWLGVLWLLAAPLRLLQAWFLVRLGELGAEATSHGAHLGALSAAIAVATVPWVYGRAVFVRACRARGDAGGRAASPLRVPPGQLLALLYLTALVETVFLLTAWTVVTIPVLVLLAGLAAACHPYLERPGPLAAVGGLLGCAARPAPLVGALFVAAAGWVVAWANLAALFLFGVWCAGALGGFDLGRWSALLAPASPRFLLLTAAGATLAVEPFWLAASAAFVDLRRARRSGDDLRRRVADLVAREAA